jgi:hypothetical protein
MYAYAGLHWAFIDSGARFWRERGMRFLSCGNQTAMLSERASELEQPA